MNRTHRTNRTKALDSDSHHTTINISVSSIINIQMLIKQSAGVVGHYETSTNVSQSIIQFVSQSVCCPLCNLNNLLSLFILTSFSNANIIVVIIIIIMIIIVLCFNNITQYVSVDYTRIYMYLKTLCVCVLQYRYTNLHAHTSNIHKFPLNSFLFLMHDTRVVCALFLLHYYEAFDWLLRICGKRNSIMPSPTPTPTLTLPPINRNYQLSSVDKPNRFIHLLTIITTIIICMPRATELNSGRKSLINYGFCCINNNIKLPI